VGLLVRARDGSAEVDVAAGHRILAREQPDLQRAAALPDVAPPSTGLICLSHKASIDSSSRTNLWTMPKIVIFMEAI
jgi:hypothetical protein